MALALLDEEKEMIEAMLAFANIEKITDGKVERCFGRVIDWRTLLSTWVDPRTGQQSRMATLVYHYRDVQEYIRNLLGCITDLDSSAREAAGQEVAAAFAQTPLGAALLFKQGRLSYVYDVGSVAVSCMLSVAMK